jgi:hypothetical protein
MAVIEAIATTYLEANATSVTFSSIPATYEHLQLRINAKTDYTHASQPSYGAIRFNGDTGSNYSAHRMMGYDTTTLGQAVTGNSEMYAGRWANAVLATLFGGVVWDILDYANTNKNTTCLILSGIGDEANLVSVDSGLWDDTAAVHTILIDQSGGSNFLRGSEFTLYGLNSS